MKELKQLARDSYAVPMMRSACFGKLGQDLKEFCSHCLIMVFIAILCVPLVGFLVVFDLTTPAMKFDEEYNGDRLVALGPRLHLILFQFKGTEFIRLEEISLCPCGVCPHEIYFSGNVSWIVGFRWPNIPLAFQLDKCDNGRA